MSVRCHARADLLSRIRADDWRRLGYRPPDGASDNLALFCRRFSALQSGRGAGYAPAIEQPTTMSALKHSISDLSQTSRRAISQHSVGSREARTRAPKSSRAHARRFRSLIAHRMRRSVIAPTPGRPLVFIDERCSPIQLRCGPRISFMARLRCGATLWLLRCRPLVLASLGILGRLDDSLEAVLHQTSDARSREPVSRISCRSLPHVPPRPEPQRPMPAARSTCR